jgi:hypothetical protein
MVECKIKSRMIDRRHSREDRITGCVIEIPDLSLTIQHLLNDLRVESTDAAETLDSRPL